MKGHEKVVSLLLQNDCFHSDWNIIYGSILALALGNGKVLKIELDIIGFRKFLSAFVNVSRNVECVIQELCGDSSVSVIENMSHLLVEPEKIPLLGEGCVNLSQCDKDGLIRIIRLVCIIKE